MSKPKIDWSKIADQIRTEETKTAYKKKEADPRFFTPDVSKDGYAEVRIRLLPSPDTDIPYVKKYNHGFMGTNGQWLIENCPTTIGEKCPICEGIQPLWEDNKSLAAERAKKLSVITNILIIKDPNHPENEGKVMLWRYGKKLHEKIMDKVNPKKGSVDEPVMVFDPENGADFKLKVKRTSFVKSGKTIQSLNYDTSEFASQSSLTKEQMKIVEDGLIPLKEFVDKSDFKSYDQLLNLFEKKTGTRASIKPSQDIPEEKQLDDSKEEEEVSAPAGTDGDDNFFANLRKKAQA
jgi:hypothetical protein